MKIKSFIFSIILLLSLNFISLPTIANEYKTAPRFVQITTNAMGYNWIAKAIAKKVIKKSLNKSAKGDYKVYVDSFSGVDLKRGKFRGLKISGQNVSIDDEIFVSKIEMETTAKFKYVKYKNKQLEFKTDIPMKYSVEVTDENLDMMLASNKFVKFLSSSIPFVKIDKIKTVIVQDKLRFTSRVRLPFSKPIKCSVSTGLKVVDGKIVFDEVEALSKKQDVTAFVQNVMNNCNFLTKMNLYIFDSSTTVLEIKNVKILENKIVIDGNITIKRAE